MLHQVNLREMDYQHFTNQKIWMFCFNYQCWHSYS
ncbi:unnamed protein product [Paramecium sonneborni]|uniref:Uncharacterized protein n=1 Tax=Paramecium sonneborni TaxID=65129 RepID=A0A8S1PW28_9CILI|nr:unnamed protein product [Paramecium sonneborni]